jgi:hypothetical protein
MKNIEESDEEKHSKAKKLLIDMVNKKVIEGEENISQYKAQIEVNSYQNK